MRLDRFLCETNMGTRSQVKQLIRSKKVIVNGTPVLDPNLKIDENTAQVSVNGNPVIYEKFVYYMLNKPKGVVSATEDGREKTVLSLLAEPMKRDLFPVGRLDKDTEGLLLLTNDGALAHNLLSPKKHVDKVYRVTALNPVDHQGILKLENGLDIGDEKPTEPAKVQLILESKNELYLTIHEGRFHQVKRMFTAIGNQVLELKRVRFGNLSLDEQLQPGESRRLTPEEVKLLNDSPRNIDETSKK